MNTGCYHHWTCTRLRVVRTKTVRMQKYAKSCCHVWIKVKLYCNCFKRVFVWRSLELFQHWVTLFCTLCLLCVGYFIFKWHALHFMLYLQLINSFKRLVEKNLPRFAVVFEAYCCTQSCEISWVFSCWKLLSLICWQIFRTLLTPL